MATNPDSGDQIRALITSMVERRPPVDEREATSIERFVAELDRLDEPCSESADITHVTASVFVVSARGLVLHRHKRLGIWIQPGGHIDPGEAAADAAVRECLEETGLRAEHFSGTPLLVHVDAHDAPKGHFHLDLRYLLAAAPDDPCPPEGESPDVRWIAWSDLNDHSDPGLAGAMAALQQFALRPAAPTDAPAVAEVFLRSFRHAYRGGLVRLAHDDTDVRRWVREEMFPANSVTVATSSGIVVGFVATAPGWIHHLYVDPAWIGRGVGGALFEHATAERPEGFSLWTFQENAPARAFYETRGLVATAFTDGDNEERQPDVRYERRPAAN
jgi:8-oxo-dGTP pyrophosphatase MutT (NUDIX family)